MEKHLGPDAVKGFCANVKDIAYNSTHWRGKNKPKKEVNKDTKDNPL